MRRHNPALRFSRDDPRADQRRPQRVKEARTWLGKAIEPGGKEIKLRARDDPDLEPLWREISDLGGLTVCTRIVDATF